MIILTPFAIRKQGVSFGANNKIASNNTNK